MSTIDIFVVSDNIKELKERNVKYNYYYIFYIKIFIQY